MRTCVDLLVGVGYSARASGSIALLFAAGCGSAPPRPAATSIDTAAIESARRSTAPRSAVQVSFAWQLQEAGARFSGQGVARVQPQYHARLDLFGPRGDTYLTAVLVENELRLPPSVGSSIVPPVPLLWSVLGVFWPPTTAEPRVARQVDGAIDLGFSGAEGRWNFSVRDSAVVAATWDAAGGGRHTVERQGVPSTVRGTQIVYRDWLAYRELTFTIEDVQHVSNFAADIWTPGW
ncbi:MAG: hypothetical protein ACRELD_13920 [Longimicrobiales bacterium]